MAENSKFGFNPIKEEIDGVKARRMIWSTSVIDKALKGIREGRKLVANPFYENNTKLLKGDLVFERTPEEIEEWKHCAVDIIYFVNKYCKLMTPEGIQHVTLRNYQEKYLQHLMNHRLSIYLSCRQSGKTTTSALFMLHYILFNVDKNALVLGNKRKTACEILDKAKKIFIELPYFLRPGLYKWNDSEIVLDNGCRLMAEATTINSGISFTFHCVLADEFAHIQPNIIDKFYNNLFPTITAGKARFMITSTQNGYNLFYRLYKAAEANESEYSAFKTDWYEVPEWNNELHCWEKRDEAWHKLQVANLGGEENFNKQFGTSFDINANTLIDNKILNTYSQRAVEFVQKELPGVSNSDSFYWKIDYDPVSQLKSDYFVITIDIAEGTGGDDTVYDFNRLFLTDDKEINTETIGYFKNNKVNAEQATRTLQEICSNYMNINHYLISLEYNLYGELFAKYIMQNIENDPQRVNLFNEDVIMKYWNEEMTKYTLGKKISSKSKLMGTSLFKQYFEKNKIINYSPMFLSQLGNFCDTKGNGTYAASFGHDDLVMAQLQMVYVIENPQYKNLCQMYMLERGLTEKQEEGYNPYADAMNPFAQIQQQNGMYSFGNQTFSTNFEQLENEMNRRRLR